MAFIQLWLLEELVYLEFGVFKQDLYLTFNVGGYEIITFYIPFVMIFAFIILAIIKAFKRKKGDKTK